MYILVCTPVIFDRLPLKITVLLRVNFCTHVYTKCYTCVHARYFYLICVFSFAFILCMRLQKCVHGRVVPVPFYRLSYNTLF